MAFNELEGVDGRFERAVTYQSADRQDRNYAHQPDERLLRNYVDPETLDSEFEGYDFPDEEE